MVERRASYRYPISNAPRSAHFQRTPAPCRLLRYPFASKNHSLLK